MFSHAFYNVVHIVGIVLLMSALGGIAVHSANGGTRTNSRTRGLIAALHGIGAFLILLGGFGMLARLGIVRGVPWGGWLWTKIAIWLVLAAIVFVPYRRPNFALPVMLALPLLGGLAAYMAIYKPF